MEDAKGLVSASQEENNSISSQGDASTEARFLDYCKAGLSLDENTCTEALELYRKTKNLISTIFSSLANSAPEEAERYWFAFVLYSVKRLRMNTADKSSSEVGDSGFNLSQILRSAKLNIVDFFKELPQFVVKAGSVLCNQYGADWEKRLEAKELQANFVHLSLLSKYYKRAFGEFFLTSDAKADEQSKVLDASSSVSDYYRFGWLLFLALRVHAFSRFKDLVTCTNGLVAILAILILHVPVHLRNFIINESPKFVKKGDKGVDLLASLCNKYETSEDELKNAMEQANNIIVDVLKKDPRPAPECKSVNLENVDAEGLIYFENLMEGGSLSSIINILEKDYADATRNKVELDERMFINDEDSLLGSGSLSGGAMNITSSKAKVDLIASPTKTITSPLSPYRSPSASHPNGAHSRTAATPVTTAMTTAKWLRTIISPLSPKPSPQLEHFLSSCDRNLNNDVTRRASIILEAIFPSASVGEQCVSGSLMDSMWAEQRKLETLKLYYRVLNSMCVAESQVLQSSNLTSLLTNERFHRCMLACSAELVLATHKTVTMLFPAVLERTGITAFDLSKVIESFVRHEDTFPRELKRHLNSLEERLLESMVWEKGSSMYNSLTVARPALSSEIIRLGLLAEPMPSLDLIALHMNIPNGSPSLHRNQTMAGLNGDMRSPKRLCTENRSALVERNPFKSPVKDRVLAIKSMQSRPALQCAFASPTRPVTGVGGGTCAEAAISVFFSKTMKLAAVRINGLIERLQLSQTIRESVYSLFQQILSQKTTLFFNRHVDQILLCCLYGVAKISQLSLTFREIIFNYRKQPHCKPQVFRSVYVDWSAERRAGKTGQEHLDIITFYNEVFVPAAKQLLVELAPNGKSRNSESKDKANGQCPGSPMVSKFPRLPDMSPKKVSASHNVYVSPLRSSKMDVLVSNGSKSYYACVGESTRAYQSPSKDLTAINTRLNGNRKVRGTLNFDEVDAGLVSDSVVANSLYQNGSCASSSDGPVKNEQPDS